jgi:hypothetical protein
MTYSPEIEEEDRRDARRWKRWSGVCCRIGKLDICTNIPHAKTTSS